MSAIGNYVKLSLKKAEREVQLSAVDAYNQQRQSIYKNFEKKQFSEAINKDLFKTIENGEKLFNKIIDELNNKAKATQSESAPSYIFNGNNDTAKIQELIQLIKDLRFIGEDTKSSREGLKKFGQLFAQITTSASFLREEIKPFLSGNNLFTISSNDYEKLKKAYKIAKQKNDITAAQKEAQKHFSGLLGNLGESIGLIVGYKFFSEELQKELKKSNISIEVSNVGNQTIDGKRVVGDTKIEFKYDGKNEVLGSISLSDKLTANYGTASRKHIKLRTTTPAQIPDEENKILYFNLFAAHSTGKKEDPPKELYPDKKSQKLAFRRYLAATILKDSLYGIGKDKGDHVFFLNYGTYIYTMDQLLNYWQKPDKRTAVPTVNFPRFTIRLALFGTDWEDITKVESIISRQALKITFSFHEGNLKNAL